MARAIRVGIDVGGTFTDAVALDAATGTLIASVKVPTTHRAAEGVAAGIVDAVRRLIGEHGIAPADIGFIAHSTTQATNALLEGDVAHVAVIGIARGIAAWLARAQIRFRALALAPAVTFTPRFAFAGDAEGACRAVVAARAAGADAVAVSEPFAVDDPGDENRVVAFARAAGFAATSGHEVSEMYGLRARTRTAALNAAILPRMLRTAEMTSQAVSAAGIGAPLMIMRSDGGVMEVAELGKRPILTLLSGPAAGVAGALLYENVTDGIFIEVGGTSSDCSAIRGGLPQMRAGRVGGVKMMLRTVDVRSIGIGGGSLVRLANGKVAGAGPRSAHIAGFAYACFSSPLLEGATFAPQPLAGETVLALQARDGTPIALTPTCAANALGCIPAGAWARGDAAAAQRAFALAAAGLRTDADALARAVLDEAASQLEAAIDELVADYGLDRHTLVVVGGGGGAGALLPYAVRRGGLEMRLARNAEVISPIGVALALVRESLERNVVDPSPAQIVALRREAKERVVAAGADPARVEVTLEVDRRQNLVRAVASGATTLAQQTARRPAGEAECSAAVARRLRLADGEAPELLARIGTMAIFVATVRARGLFGRVAAVPYAALCDDRAVVRLVVRNARCSTAPAAACEPALRAAIEAATTYGDVGRSLPLTYIVFEGRWTDVSGVSTAEQAIALAREELQGLPPTQPIALVTAPAT